MVGPHVCSGITPPSWRAGIDVRQLVLEAPSASARDAATWSTDIQGKGDRVVPYRAMCRLGTLPADRQLLAHTEPYCAGKVACKTRTLFRTLSVSMSAFGRPVSRTMSLRTTQFASLMLSSMNSIWATSALGAARSDRQTRLRAWHHAQALRLWIPASGGGMVAIDGSRLRAANTHKKYYAKGKLARR